MHNFALEIRKFKFTSTFYKNNNFDNLKYKSESATICHREGLISRKYTDTGDCVPAFKDLKVCWWFNVLYLIL